MRKLKRFFTKYFVPHKRNKYKPYFLRIEVAGLVALAIVVLFLASIAQSHLLMNGSPQSAAVIASSLVDLANGDRAQNGLPPLTINSQLQEAAQLKANDMVANGYFAHTSPSGKDPWYWFQQAGYDFSYAGENLAVYFSDSDSVNTAWMNSPEHRANLLDVNYTQIGIATADGLYQGVETTFVVEEFGSPAAVAVASEAPTPVESAATSPVPTAPVATAPATPKVAPEVEGASVAPPVVKVVAQDPDAIAVKNVNATPVPAPAGNDSTPASSNSLWTLILRFVTSPESDLTIVYEAIGAIIVLALFLEIGVELRRQHPHRIVIGLSLIMLILILGYADHTFIASTVLIS
jgi:uncharacterized protein YkwD